MPATTSVTVAVITSRTQYEILRLFAEGKSEIEIADFTTLEQRAVTRVINEMCAGDQATARNLVAAYERRAATVAAAQGRPAPGLTRQSPAAQTSPAAPARPDVDPLRTIAGLLAAAAKSPHQRTRTLGERLRTIADDLRDRLEDEKRAAEAAEAAAKARAEAQKRVDELAAQLAAARAALKAAGGTANSTATPASEVPAKVVREWARKNGVAVPALGRIPRDVMDAYQKHQEKEQQA